jgi:SSS family transporter
MHDLPDLRLHWLDGTIIAAYLLALLGVGFYHARRQASLKDFFLAGGEIKWLAMGLSLMAALNSGMDYLMQPASMIKFGLYTIIGSASWLLLYPYVFHVVLPLYRRLGTLTAYEYLERRFDARVRLLAAGIFVLWRLGWMATALYVPALALGVATGGRLPVTGLIVVIGAVVTAYTMLGGIRAVIWNDVFQFCLMFAGLAVAVVICLVEVDGGLAGILAQIPRVGAEVDARPPSGTGGWLAYFHAPVTALGLFISVFVARTGTYTSDQVMVQRFQTARTIGDARRGFLIDAIADTVWMLTLSFVGLALFAFFQAKFGGLPSWAAAQPDQLFPYFIAHVFPIGLVGLVIAAILAASISSIDSALNSLTSVVMVDFLGRWRRSQPATDAGRVRLSRLLTAGIGAVGVGLALNVAALGSLLEISNKIINSFAGPILGIYLLGMFARRASAGGVLVGGVAGTLVAVYVAFQREVHALLNGALGTAFGTQAGISFLWPSTFGLAATITVGALASFLLPAHDPAASSAWLWRNVARREPTA